MKIKRRIVIGLIGLIITCSLFADADVWSIRFGLFSADSVFVDNWVFAGTHPEASDTWDIRDIQKFFPPTSEYAIIFFPHSNPSEPDYWPWPNNYDYSSDIRTPLDSAKTWRIKIRSFYSYSRTLTIWWSELDDLPGDYLPVLVKEDNDTINMRERFDYTAVFPPGVQRWKLTVIPGYYDRMSVRPHGSIVRVAERRHFRAYLHHGADSIRANTAVWSYRGSGGWISEDGYFTGTSPGGGFVIADIGGVKDSAEVTVIPGGYFFQIPLERGWNLISLPALPFSNRYDDIVPGIIPPIYWWDADSQKHRISDTLVAGKAYFALSPNDAITEFAGTPFDSVSAPILRGWNMVGGPSQTAYYPSDFQTYPPGIIVVPPFVFNGNEYILADSLSANRGCWVLSMINGELKIISH